MAAKTFADVFAQELAKKPEEPKVSTASSSGLVSLEDLFDEIPVGLDVFIKDKKFLGQKIDLSPIQSDAIRHIERIYYKDMYAQLAQYDPYWSESIRLVNHITCQWGKGGGKDTVCRIASLRIAYLLLSLKSPQDYFGMPEDDDIHMINVAMSSTQAQTAFFNPLRRNISRGWFKDRSESSKSEIHYAKNVIGISGHSETESQEGLNLILGICDEIDGFKTKAELARFQGASVRDSTKSAESIMEMIWTSGKTRFPETHKMACISFPRYLGSTIQKLCERGNARVQEQGVDSHYYVSGPFATWEANPTKKRWMYKDDYDEDSVMARAKYECAPTYAANPYYHNSLAIENCFTDTEPVKVSYSHNGTVWEPSYEFSEDFYPVQGAVYAMHADLAIKGDRAGVAMSHTVRREPIEKEVFGEGGNLIKVTDMLPYVKVDFVIAFEADISVQPSREIQIRWVRDLWAKLKLLGFNIRQLSYDGYQSQESRQEMERLGVAAPLLSTDRTEEHWKGLRDLMYGQRVLIPYNDILAKELLSLTKLPNGKVDHQTTGSKDMADALACSCTGALMLGGEESKDGARAYYAPPEFIIGDHNIPELKFLEHDPMNIILEEMSFDTPLGTSGWSDLSSSWGDF